jgi:hypothetical protein
MLMAVKITFYPLTRACYLFFLFRLAYTAPIQIKVHIRNWASMTRSFVKIPQFYIQYFPAGVKKYKHLP